MLLYFSHWGQKLPPKKYEHFLPWWICDFPLETAFNVKCVSYPLLNLILESEGVGQLRCGGGAGLQLILSFRNLSDDGVQLHPRLLSQHLVDDLERDSEQSNESYMPLKKKLQSRQLKYPVFSPRCPHYGPGPRLCFHSSEIWSMRSGLASLSVDITCSSRFKSSVTLPPYTWCVVCVSSPAGSGAGRTPAALGAASCPPAGGPEDASGGWLRPACAPWRRTPGRRRKRTNLWEKAARS